MKKLQAARVATSQPEGEKTVLEIAKHAAIILPELAKLKNALDER